MDKIIGAFSLYDVLSMVIPGGTILLFLQVLFAADLYPLRVLINKEQNVDFDILLVIGVVVAYIIGICNHLLSTEIWKGFRNNSFIIRRELDKVIAETPNPLYLKVLCCNLGATATNNDMRNTVYAYLRGAFWLVWAIFVSCSILQFVLDISVCNFDCIYIIGICFLVFSVVLILAVPLFEEGQNDRKIIDAYYNAYYYVLQTYKSSDISVLEGQVAFLESMFIPILAFLCIPYNSLISFFMLSNVLNASYVIFLFKCLIALLWLGLLPAILSRIGKIHELVWYDYEYLKRMEK